MRPHTGRTITRLTAPSLLAPPASSRIGGGGVEAKRRGGPFFTFCENNDIGGRRDGAYCAVRQQKRQCFTSASDLMNQNGSAATAAAAAAEEKEEEGLRTTPAANLTLRDVAGPWLVMSNTLSGEMMIHEDGFVTFKLPSATASAAGDVGSSGGVDPATDLLGNCIGTITLVEDAVDGNGGDDGTSATTNTFFRIDLEAYLYSRTKPTHPPFSPTKYVLTGAVNKAVSVKPAYETLTLSGFSLTNEIVMNAKQQERSEKKERNSNGGGMEAALEAADGFHAAKLLPWDPSTDTPGPLWRPKKDVADSFKSIFGGLPPLSVTSHVARAQKKEAAMMKLTVGTQQQTNEEGGGGDGEAHHPPFHLDLEPYRVGAIPSIYYIPNYISGSEEAQFMAHLKATPDALKTKLPKRTCQEWGGTMCATCNKSFVADRNMPPWAESVNEMLLHDGIFTPTTFPNSVRIHEYDQYEGIGPHCDGPIYVPRVAVLSMASTSVMHFYPRTEPYGPQQGVKKGSDGSSSSSTDITQHYNDTFKFEDGVIGRQKPIASVVVEPGSLLLFTDEAFTHYPHGVSDKPTDDLRGLNVVNRHLLSVESRDVEVIQRRYRASVTVRNMLPRCAHDPARNDYMMRRAFYHYHQTPLPADASEAEEWDLTPTAVGRAPPPAAKHDDGQASDSTTHASHRGVKAIVMESKFDRLKRTFAQPQQQQQEATHTTSAQQHHCDPSVMMSSSPSTAPSSSPAALPSSAASDRRDADDGLYRAIVALAASQARLSADVADIKSSLDELKAVMGFSFTSATTFQKETSSILNHLSMAVMDVTSKQEDLAETLEDLKQQQQQQQGEEEH